MMIVNYKIETTDNCVPKTMQLKEGPLSDNIWDDELFRTSVHNGLKLVDIKELFSTYYFTSRVLNAAINPKPSYNDLLNLDPKKKNLFKYTYYYPLD